jgi:hypothetical protein
MKLRLIAITFLSVFFLATTYAKKKTPAPVSDRQQWVELCYRIAAPVLENMSKGELQKNMPLELSPNWDEGRDKRATYMETFGRLMAGISPWLMLPDDETEEGKLRKQIREWALLSYKNAVDPESPDYLAWESKANQKLVDAAFIAQSFLRAPEATWQQLDETTQKRYIERFQNMKTVRPAYNNWLLFRGLIEAFLMSIGEEADQYVLSVTANKMNEWYLSDGWYSDGDELALDYYNAFVIHPMYVEMMEVLAKNKFWTPISADLTIKRMQRFNVFMERLISPEGTFPAFGRSLVYRMGAFQTLAMAAWKYGMPKGLSNGQVRSALTAVMHNMFKIEGNFDEQGFLRLGFAGHQPGLANAYTNNGSLYMTSLVFMPLGLPADHPFWTDAAEPWTSQKAWSGQPFPIDGHHSLRK